MIAGVQAGILGVAVVLAAVDWGGFGGAGAAILIGAVTYWRTEKAKKDAKSVAEEAKGKAVEVERKVDENKVRLDDVAVRTGAIERMGGQVSDMAGRVVRVEELAAQSVATVTKALEACVGRERDLLDRVARQGMVISKLRFDNRKIMRVLADIHPDAFEKPEPPEPDEDGGIEEDYR